MAKAFAYLDFSGSLRTTRWRSNSLSNDFPFWRKDQGSEKGGKCQRSTDLAFFSRSISKFDFAKLPLKCHFHRYIISYLFDNKEDGGGRGIRTPVGLSTKAVFKTACFNRSHIPPRLISIA